MIAIKQGLVDTLCTTCIQLKWNEPTKIQREAIPLVLEGNVNNETIISQILEKYIDILILM